MKPYITLFGMLVLVLNTAFAATVPSPLVDPSWLDANKDKVVILDVRANVPSFTAQPVFAKNKKTGKKQLVQARGHIKGALLVPYKNIRGEQIIDGKKVQKMILDKVAFEKQMQSSGLDRDRPIVIVSRGHNNLDMTMATRLYWQLKYYGSDDMAILNGGMAGWILAGKPVSTEAPKTRKGNWLATAERREILATSDEVAQAVDQHSAQLIDNRPLDQYMGTWHKSYVYAPGHIPGAKLYANTLMTRPKAPASFLPTDELSALAKGLGIDPMKPSITYCNSGHLASGGWFIMHELLGNKNTKLYDGSMHEWTLEKHPVKAFVLEK